MSAPLQIIVDIPNAELAHTKSTLEYSCAIVRILVQAGIPNNGALGWQNVSYGKIERIQLSDGTRFRWTGDTHTGHATA